MLAVLSGADVTNICVVVTRYFGGVLLGTGGLVRAYSRAVQEGLNACTISECIEGFRLRIRTDYNGIGKIQYVLGQKGLPVTDTSYTDMVEIETMLPVQSLHQVKSEITEKTNAKALFVAEEAVRYALDGGMPVVLGDDYFSEQ